MQFNLAYSYLMPRLENELPAYLTYHNAEHTKAVIHAVSQLVKNEKLPEEDVQLLYTAALYHDAGFLKGNQNHEYLSCSIARDCLPQFGYSADQIERICSLIMATKLPQEPKDILEMLLCDADLFYLGTDRYLKTSRNLFKELKELGLISNWDEWQELQIQFLTKHQYFTQSAISQCAQPKLENLRFLTKEKVPNKLKNKSNGWDIRLQDVFLICIGVIVAGFGLKGFLVPNHFFDGGVTGISLLVHKLFNFNLPLTTIVLNLPFVFWSYFSVSRTFAVKTLVSVLLLGFCLLYMPYPVITSDKLLISIFGGFFLGIGSGLAMRAGSSLDGIEVLALYTWKKTSFTISEIILGINIVIFAVAALKYGLETSLYSILTYFTASKTIDYVVEGIEAHTGVTIISGRSEIIKHKLVNELRRGITVYKGERGFLPDTFEVSSECDILFTVVSRLELRKLNNLVHETDPNAFVFAYTIKEATGGIIKRRQMH
jgi:uncharacterized membrane-anchored protein YitT (DUF2179 family)/predicted metal-dependent HD superfamily phosphohydrolase